MDFVTCIVPVSPMRKEAAHRSEMVSQMLFGECASVLEEAGDFVKVRAAFDHYEGWCQRTQLRKFHADAVPHPLGYTEAHCSAVSLQGGLAWLPFGSPVYTAAHSNVLFGEGVDYSEVVQPLLPVSQVPTENQIRAISLRFLNTSYLWGGKSVFGIDCSGFSQQVYKLLGIPLLRDAYQQAEQGEAVHDFNATIAGDLAFFDNEAGRITHVGILLGPNQIIHASGRVRIDRQEPDGIYNEEGRRTHRLHSIRRVAKLM